MKTIEESTPLLPDVVAASVVAEVSGLITLYGEGHHPAAILADRAEVHFQKTPTFRRKILGDSGREHLYAYMRHWLAGMLIAAGCPRNELPTGWANGQPLHH